MIFKTETIHLYMCDCWDSVVFLWFSITSVMTFTRPVFKKQNTVSISTKLMSVNECSMWACVLQASSRVRSTLTRSGGGRRSVTTSCSPRSGTRRGLTLKPAREVSLIHSHALINSHSDIVLQTLTSYTWEH